MHDEVTQASIDSFKFLRDHLVKEGVLLPDPPIDGHRHAPGNSTACPGDNLLGAMDALRSPSASTTQVQESTMIIAWGQDMWGKSIGILAAGGRPLKQFTGPPGAYGIPQDALDWKAQPGREAVQWVVCDPATLGALGPVSSGAMAICHGKNASNQTVGYLISGGRVLKAFIGPEGLFGLPADAIDWKMKPGREAVDWIAVGSDILSQLAATWPASGGTAPAPGGVSDADAKKIANQVADTFSSRLGF